MATFREGGTRALVVLLGVLRWADGQYGICACGVTLRDD